MHPIFKVTGKLSPYFRRRRMGVFLDWFKPTAETRVLDLGGLPRFWAGVPIEAHLTLLNLYELDEYDRSFMTARQETVVGDATHLDYDDGEFDIVFSNSVIEHLGTPQKQSSFAREAQRVGKCYWIQTPAREFLVEPHYLTLCVHWFPKHIQKRLLRNFSLWGLLGRPTNEVLDTVLAELRLLSLAEFKWLFGRGHVLVERVLGLPKSYTAWGRRL